MEKLLVKEILSCQSPYKNVRVEGWVRTRRDSKTFSFIEINDGSCLKNLQIIIDVTLSDYTNINQLTTGSSVAVFGKLVESVGKGQKWELQADGIKLIGASDTSYPLQKKGHSQEFLRDIAHLRPRSNIFGCIFRLRNRLSYAVHNFFQERNFILVHTPIITASDCEGAGELFRVTTINGKLNGIEDNGIDYSKDFFARPTYLTVSGQLEAEIFASAFTKVYTFGPTFRAENSNTSRHASEFWMIEPEMAFCDLEGNMDMAESLVKYLVQDTLVNCDEDLQLFTRFIDKDLLKRLNFVLDKPFERITYSDAVNILKKSGQKFKFPVSYGSNLQSEHERFLTEKHFKRPVTVFNYPRAIKPFYMRLNENGKTVRAMDVLVPGIGEIVGGSQREERLDVLLDNFKTHHLDPKEYWWYLELRKYGTVPHSGFGLGFERMLMFLTGIPNIRDVIPFPRTPGSADF